MEPLDKEHEKENFYALTANSVVDVTQVDPTKFYYVGRRSKSNTTSPAQNGGTECPEFPDVVYQLAPVINATCQTSDIVGGNVDTNYTFDKTLSVKGNILYPRFFSISTSSNPTTAKWISINGNNAVLVDGSGAVYITTLFNTAQQSWTLIAGNLKQVSLNKDGFKEGTNSSGSLFGAYPLTSQSWAYDGSGNNAVQLEVGSSKNGNPTNPLQMHFNTSGNLYAAIWGVSGWQQISTTTPGPVSSLSIDNFIVAITAKNDGKIYYADFNPLINGGAVSSPSWIVVPGSEAINFKFISAGEDGRALGIGADGQIYKCSNYRAAAPVWKVVKTTF